MLSGKALQQSSTSQVKLTADTEEIQISISQRYKPESGDQLLVPKQESTRKRRGRPQHAGPSTQAKRVKKVTVNDFYIGKLSNLVNLSSSKRRHHQ